MEGLHLKLWDIAALGCLSAFLGLVVSSNFELDSLAPVALIGPPLVVNLLLGRLVPEPRMSFPRITGVHSAISAAALLSLVALIVASPVAGLMVFLSLFWLESSYGLVRALRHQEPRSKVTGA